VEHRAGWISVNPQLRGSGLWKWTGGGISGTALLFAAARADHVAKLIRPALARGDWVICDRFVDSTRAYQGGAGGVSDTDILDLHRIGAGGLLPDRTLLLDLAAGDGAQRAAGRDGGEADRMGSKPPGYYDRVATRFREIADEEPARFRIIDAQGSVDDVTQRLLAAIEGLL